MKDLFIKIINGELPSEKIYEDDMTYAFLDINPTNKGHTLVVPKNHSENIYDIKEEDWTAVMKTVRLLSPKIKKALNADGINIIMNNEKSAGQLVPHSHVHIIPRYEADGFKHWKGTPYQEGEMERIGEKIRSVLD
ncbi:MAG TPA: HIT family protein [Candidatus Kaiserbacteria bacterium]|nr:HIT family protein [Candidatus Kaiserbacteria bacterium]